MDDVFKKESEEKEQCPIMDKISQVLEKKESEFKKFVIVLKSTLNNFTTSKVTLIDSALDGTKCALSFKYEDYPIKLQNGRMNYGGILSIEGIVVGRGIGKRKRDAKQATCTLAFNNFVDKPLVEALKCVAECKDIDKKQERSGKAAEKKKTPEEKISALITEVKNAAFLEHSIVTIDSCALDLEICPLSLYRMGSGQEGQTPFICELYIEDVWLGTGESEKRKSAQLEAYNNAFDNLCTLTCEYILKEHKRLTPEEKNHPNVIDVWVKGEGKQYDSNIAGLKKLGFNAKEGNKKIEDFVVFQYDTTPKDMIGNAFWIMNHSATVNAMLLQWSFEQDGFIFKCDLKLQGETVGECCRKNKTNAKNLAAADALFKFYQSQNVIQFVKRDDTKLWIAYEDILAEADKAKEAELGITVTGEIEGKKTAVSESETAKTAESEFYPGKTEESKTKTLKMKESETKLLKTEVSEDTTQTDTELVNTVKAEDKVMDNTDALINSVKAVDETVPNKWVMNIIKEHINTFNLKNTLDEVIFGPKMPTLEKEAMFDIAKKLDLKIELRTRKRQGYYVFTKKRTPIEIVECLKQNRGSSGKYTLLLPSDLPSHDDIGKLAEELYEKSHVQKDKNRFKMEGKKESKV